MPQPRESSIVDFYYKSGNKLSSQLTTNSLSFIPKDSEPQARDVTVAKVPAQHARIQSSLIHNRHWAEYADVMLVPVLEGITETRGNRYINRHL